MIENPDFREFGGANPAPPLPEPDTSPEPGPAPDPVNYPEHYRNHPSGVECIVIAEHFNFCLGNVIKYLWRAPMKGATLQDLEKARWYLDREIKNRKREEAR